MKKSNLIYGLIYTILAGISLYVAITFDNKMSGIFYGMTGALGANGIFMIIRYFYWKKNKEKYQEKLEIEEIEQNDELKQKLRDKAEIYLLDWNADCGFINYGLFRAWCFEYHGYRTYCNLFRSIFD